MKFEDTDGAVTVCEIAPPSDHPANRYCVPVPPACTPGAEIVCCVPGAQL
ncbi:MAG: hypothetical protein LC126_30200 [Bryobacterales bacterium]|nr:hypothetical protein [Bryobacterales bacterium]